MVDRDPLSDSRSGPNASYDVDLILADARIGGASSCRDLLAYLFDAEATSRRSALGSFDRSLLVGEEIEARILSHSLSLLIKLDPDYQVRQMALEVEAEALEASLPSPQTRRYLMGDMLRASCYVPVPDMIKVRQTAFSILDKNKSWLVEPAAYNYPANNGIEFRSLASGIAVALDEGDAHLPTVVLKGCAVEALSYVTRRRFDYPALGIEIREVFERLLNPHSSIYVSDAELRGKITEGKCLLGPALGT